MRKPDQCEDTKKQIEKTPEEVPEQIPFVDWGEEACGQAEAFLWDALSQLQGRSFYTSKNLEFTYNIKGNEMFVNRKEKSITRATVNKAFYKALELDRIVTGPKKLGTFGASYLYPVFIELGIVRKC